jgi:hypothetical protein
MDSSQLARLMLDWGELCGRMEQLEVEIRAAVMEIGKTQTVGNVRATYSGGRRSYDYETAVKSADVSPDDYVTVTRVDFKATCDRAMIIVGDALVTQSPPSVTVKLLE